MDINTLTLAQIKEIGALIGAGPKTEIGALIGAGPKTETVYKIGQAYFIRTVTMSYTGRVAQITEHELVFNEVCWIADAGRFNQAVLGNWDSNAEHEPMPDGTIIGRGAIVDACPVSFKLPNAVK